jgi:hypothetical protein
MEVMNLAGFISPTKEVVLLNFINLKYPSPRLGLNPRTLDPVGSTLTIKSILEKQVRSVD